jgi:hypothetical protein
MDLFNPNILFASLLWGSIGIGYCIYGRRQQSLVPLIGGVLMVAASYLANSVLMMSLICILLMSFVYMLVKRGC